MDRERSPSPATMKRSETYFRCLEPSILLQEKHHFEKKCKISSKFRQKQVKERFSRITAIREFLRVQKNAFDRIQQQLDTLWGMNCQNNEVKRRFLKFDIFVVFRKLINANQSFFLLRNLTEIFPNPTFSKWKQN